MGYYNEADTRAKLIDPKLRLAGWGEGQIEREHYFVKGRAVTDGRIYLVGEEARRREPRRVDYLLRYDGQMIAVLEAKDERHSPDAGLEQAKSYARLLDVPSCRNVVFMKPIASPVLFKQIVGRGSRVDPTTGKEWFRVIDYVGASRLFDEWDRPPGEPPPTVEGPRTSALEGTVLDAETGAFVVGASVSVQVAANEQHGPVRTDENGRFRFEGLPAGTVRTHVRGPGFRPRSAGVETAPGETASVAFELRREAEPARKIRVRGIEVTIADEATFFVEDTGERLTLSEYLDYTRRKVAGYVPDSARLHAVWTDQRKREEFLRELEAASIEVDVLADVLARPEADRFDLLAHIAFGEPIRTRGERAEAFVNYEQGFITGRGAEARGVILALLEKYRIAGVGEMTAPEVYDLSPFREMGRMRGVARRLGGTEALRETLDEMQKRIYRKEGV